jgi:hypothetical protein
MALAFRLAVLVACYNRVPRICSQPKNSIFLASVLRSCQPSLFSAAAGRSCASPLLQLTSLLAITAHGWPYHGPLQSKRCSLHSPAFHRPEARQIGFSSVESLEYIHY